MTRGSTLFALLSALTLSSAAHAQSPASTSASAESGEQASAADTSDVVEQARAHFKKGVDYYAEGDLNAARIELERAYALQPAWRLLYNLAQVASEQREYAAAERYYRDYLAQGRDAIDAERRSEVEHELGRLQERVADVSITTNVAGARLFVDGDEVGRAPLAQALRLSAGRRVLRAESPGHAPVSRELDVIGGEQRSFELRFGPALAAAKPASADSASTAPHPALWTAIATGVLALGAGGMALWANSDDNAYARELEQRTTRSRLDDLNDRTKTKALITDVLLGSALASAAVTVVLLLVVDEHEEQREQAAATQSGLVLSPSSLRVTF